VNAISCYGVCGSAHEHIWMSQILCIAPSECTCPAVCKAAYEYTRFLRSVQCYRFIYQGATGRVKLHMKMSKGYGVMPFCTLGYYGLCRAAHENWPVQGCLMPHINIMECFGY
jgi:hypothetical protein